VGVYILVVTLRGESDFADDFCNKIHEVVVSTSRDHECRCTRRMRTPEVQ
jgi:hypothetical protein